MKKSNKVASVPWKLCVSGGGIKYNHSESSERVAELGALVSGTCQVDVVRNERRQTAFSADRSET